MKKTANSTIFNVDLNSLELFNCVDKTPHNGLRRCYEDEVIKISKVLKLKIPINYIFYFQLKSNHVSRIHIDRDITAGDKELPKFALNIPLHDSSLHMDWYRSMPNVEIGKYKGTPNHNGVPFLDVNNAIHLERCYFKGPMIAKNDDWHSISNDDPLNVSHMISIRFDHSISRDSVEEMIILRYYQDR